MSSSSSSNTRSRRKCKSGLIVTDKSKGTQHAGTQSEKGQMLDETHLARDANDNKGLLCKYYIEKCLRMWCWLVSSVGK